MAFNLSSPVAKLAFEMALRNQQAQDSSAPFDASARSFVSKALATGNDQLAPFEDIYRQYVDPAEAQRRAQAAAFNEYLIGLPELLAKASKEGRSTGGTSGGVGLVGNPNSDYLSPQERLQNLIDSFPKQTTAPYDPLRNRTTQSAYSTKTATTTPAGTGSGPVSSKPISTINKNDSFATSRMGR